MPFELVANYLDGEGRKVFHMKTEQNKLLHCMHEPDLKWLVGRLNEWERREKEMKALIEVTRQLLGGLEAVYVESTAAKVGDAYAVSAEWLVRELTGLEKGTLQTEIEALRNAYTVSMIIGGSHGHLLYPATVKILDDAIDKMIVPRFGTAEEFIEAKALAAEAKAADEARQKGAEHAQA